MNQWQRHCWLPGGDQGGMCLSLAQPSQSHPAPPPATYRRESGTKKGECPCPPALDWQRIISEVPLSRPLSPHIKIHWGPAPRRVTIPAHWPPPFSQLCWDGQRWRASPKLPPSPALSGRAQGFEILFLEATERMEASLTREKGGATMEKGGFQTEHLPVEDE